MLQKVLEAMSSTRGEWQANPFIRKANGCCPLHAAGFPLSRHPEVVEIMEAADAPLYALERGGLMRSYGIRMLMIESGGLEF